MAPCHKTKAAPCGFIDVEFSCGGSIPVAVRLPASLPFKLCFVSAPLGRRHYRYVVFLYAVCRGPPIFPQLLSLLYINTLHRQQPEEISSVLQIFGARKVTLVFVKSNKQCVIVSQRPECWHVRLLSSSGTSWFQDVF